MKICVISNSHAASLKNGWKSIQDSFPNDQLTFFASPNRGLARLKADLDKKTLYTNNDEINEFLSYTSGGQEVIDVQEYDAFLVYGLFLILPRLDVRVSSGIKKATISDTVQDSINYRIVADLCNLTNVPVFYSAEPLLSDSILGDEAGNPESIADYSSLCDWVAEHYNHSNALQIQQLPHTIGERLTTHKKYSIGSEKLTKDSVKHTPDDVRHMNGVYGEEYLKVFLDQAKTYLTEISSRAA